MAKKQKKSSTDSLSALISQMQGELPDISDTNYLEIEGGAGNVETINKRIEGDIEENDRQETLRAQNAKEMADRRFTEYRQLSGLVSDAKKVHDWWKKEREAGLLHDSIRDNKTRRIEEIEKSGEKISPETYNETIEQGGAVLWNTDMDQDEGLVVSEALWNEQVSEVKGDAKDIALHLEGSISSMLASHSGFARLSEYKDGIAYVLLGGGWQGCPSSQMTLMAGVKTELQEMFGDDLIKDVMLT